MVLGKPSFKTRMTDAIGSKPIPKAKCKVAAHQR